MRRVLAGIALVAALVLAQASRSAEELGAYIRTAVADRYKDADVASSIDHMRLSTRLTPEAVTELQRLGAGPKTVAALTRLSKASASLPAAPPKAAPAASPAPSAAEQRQLIEETRENALNYTRSLPNYMCRQVTKRHVDPNGNGWRTVDQIVEQLSFFDRKESYKVMMVNDSMVTNNLQHDQLGGATSSGEFGTILHAIFDPETGSEFSWSRWENPSRDREGAVVARAAVFSFHTARPMYTIRHQDSHRSIATRTSGEIFIDPRSKMVIRLHLECEGIPGDFPIRAVTLDQDYAYADIGEQRFLLPLHSDVRSREAGYQSWNEVSFSGYRKFSADANITFK